MNYRPIVITLFLSITPQLSNLQAADSLHVDVSGNVGIGTSIPTRKLHVEDSNDPGILVKRNTAVPAERSLLTLSNTGKTRFLITNGPDAWTFDNAGSFFQINKVGTGLPVEFEVQDNGDGFFAGDVYAKGVMLSSSRERKTDFEPVDSQEVLKQLAQLEVLSWRYKGDDEDGRHIGPVAEDFQSIFEIGNGTHISAVDTTGIAFAAIKSLYDETLQNAAEMEALKIENEGLKQRLQNLEDLLLRKEPVSSPSGGGLCLIDT